VTATVGEAGESAAIRQRLSPEDLHRIDAYWRAANYLSVGQIYLMDNPCCENRCGRAHKAPPARPLGNDSGVELPLRPYEPGHPGLGPQRDLRRRSRPWRSRRGCQRLPRGHLLRAVPARGPRRSRASAAVPAVLLPRRHTEPCRTRDAGVDKRGWRAGLLPRPRIRRRLRQPRSARVLRGRRRRGGDRPACDELALQQVSRPRPRRRRAPRAAPERIQDRQPDLLARIPEDELISLFEGYGYRVHTVSGDEPTAMHSRWRRPRRGRAADL